MFFEKDSKLFKTGKNQGSDHGKNDGGFEYVEELRILTSLGQF